MCVMCFLITNYNGIYIYIMVCLPECNVCVMCFLITNYNGIYIMSGDTTPISTILMATSMGEMMRNRGFCGMFQTAPSESVITHSHHLINPLVNPTVDGCEILHHLGWLKPYK